MSVVVAASVVELGSVEATMFVVLSELEGNKLELEVSMVSLDIGEVMLGMLKVKVSDP